MKQAADNLSMTVWTVYDIRNKIPGFHSTPVKKKCVQDRNFFQIRIQQLN